MLGKVFHTVLLLLCEQKLSYDQLPLSLCITFHTSKGVLAADTLSEKSGHRFECVSKRSVISELHVCSRICLLSNQQTIPFSAAGASSAADGPEHGAVSHLSAPVQQGQAGETSDHLREVLQEETQGVRPGQDARQGNRVRELPAQAEE